MIATETFEPEVGGGETQCRTLADALMSRGYDVVVVTRCSRPALSRRERQGRLEIVRVGPVGPGRWKKWALLVTSFPALLGAARGAHVVLVSGFRFLGSPAVVAARRGATPCVLKADNRGELSGEYFRAGLRQAGMTTESLPVRAFVRARNAVLLRADAFVALSREMEQEYAAAGVRIDRIHAIPNAVDVDRFSPATSHERRALRARLALPEGPVAIFSGRLVTHKGVLTLLRAWKGLQDAGIAGHLVLLGEGGADMHACEADARAFVRDHGLEGSVRLAGAVPNVVDFLRVADCFVFPTVNDALPLALIEAMACGLPVLTTPVGAIGDFVVDGVNGILVPAGDESALGAALGRLLRGRPDAPELGRAARDTAMRRFSHHAVADDYERLFDRVRSARGIGNRS